MIGTITSSRRITIPKEVYDQSNLPPSIKADVTFDGKSFIVTPILETNKKEETVVNKPKVTKVESNKPRKESKPRKIVSNLEDGLKFKVQYFSKCGLVIRTKNRYLKDFCKACKGKLVDDYELDIDKCCNYCGNRTKQEEKPVKEQKNKTTKNILEDKVEFLRKSKKVIIDDIKSNKQQLEQKIDTEIKNTLKSEDAKVLQPVLYEGYKSCTNCRTLCESGFLINYKFFCKSCALEDFKNYYMRKKGMSENV